MNSGSPPGRKYLLVPDHKPLELEIENEGGGVVCVLPDGAADHLDRPCRMQPIPYQALSLAERNEFARRAEGYVPLYEAEMAYLGDCFEWSERESVNCVEPGPWPFLVHSARRSRAT